MTYLEGVFKRNRQRKLVEGFQYMKKDYKAFVKKRDTYHDRVIIETMMERLNLTKKKEVKIVLRDVFHQLKEDYMIFKRKEREKGRNGNNGK